MFSLYVACVRSIYLLAVVIALVLGGWLLLQYVAVFLRSDSFGRSHAQDMVIITFLLACVLPATRATIRLLRHRELVPDTHLRDRPLVSSLVAMASALAIALLYLLLHVWLAILPWGADDVGGPLAGAAMLAVILLVFALLTGEIVLVGHAHRRPG